MAETFRWTNDLATPSSYSRYDDKNRAVNLAHKPPYDYHRRMKHIGTYLHLRHYYVSVLTMVFSK